MTLTHGFFCFALALPILMGCEDTSAPTVPIVPVVPTGPTAPVDSIPGFVPLAVGNFWKYSLHGSWYNGHNGSGAQDTGFRQITILSRGDSIGLNLIHARIEDSIYSQQIVFNFPAGDPQAFGRDLIISVLEDSTHLRLVPGTKDDDGMLAAFFRSHAFPADSIVKVPGKDYAIPGLPDSIRIARERTAPGEDPTIQAQAIGLLVYKGSSGGSFNADGSITPAVNQEYHLLEFRIAH